MSRRSSGSIFPTYLLPSLTFRPKSRHNSTDSTSTTDSNNTTSTARTSVSIALDSPSSNPFSRTSTPVPPPVASEPVEPTDKFLHGNSSHITCSKCNTDLALSSQIISKGFHGRHGRAFLVAGHPMTRYSNTTETLGRDGALPNTFLGRPETRSLVTGPHIVRELFCNVCDSVLGWKYIQASETAQRYKVGKFILETRKVRVSTRWDNAEDAEFGHTGVEIIEKADDSDEGQVDFDSQDEDECEDLFTGLWSPALAVRRRQRKSERYRRKAERVYLPRTGGSQDSLV